MQDGIKIGNRYFDKTGKTYIMGILNVTPDSFFDGGSYQERDKALLQVKKMVEEGADLIDVGGESTRPNYTKIEVQEEIGRIVPVIRLIKDNFDIPVSVDTYKADVARAAVEAGADLVNDIWGLKYEEKMAEVIQDTGVSVCIMHNRKEMNYQDFLKDIFKDLKESVCIAKRAGIKEDKIILDPGIGFSKTREMNLICLKHLEEFQKFSYPVLLGASRKSVIGMTLNLPVMERLEGTLATSVLAVMKGCQFVRVHDVKENKRAIAMTEAILKI